MNIVITGAKGLWKNLKADLTSTTDYHIFEVHRQTKEEELESALLKADFVVHLAGVNRPEHEFSLGNVSYLDHVLDILTRNKKSRRYYYRLQYKQHKIIMVRVSWGTAIKRVFRRVWQYGLYLSMAKFIR